MERQFETISELGPPEICDHFPGVPELHFYS